MCIRDRRLDAVEDKGVGYLFDHVQDVIQAGDEGVDLLAIEGRDEGSLEPAPDVVADLVAAALRLPNLLGRLVGIVERSQHRLELAGAVKDVGRVLHEEVKESLFAWDQSKRGHLVNLRETLLS